MSTALLPVPAAPPGEARANAGAPGTLHSGEPGSVSAGSQSAVAPQEVFTANFDSSGLDLLGRALGPLESYRFQEFSAAFESIRLQAQASTQRNGVLSTASLLYQRSSFEARISSASLERFAGQVSDLESTDPELLQDYLALIKMLDERTPDSLDPFFDKLENILRGIEEPGSEAAAAQIRSFFIEVRVEIVGFDLTITQQQQQSDPLVLDLDGDGIELSDARSGRRFDINADGRIDTSAFVTGGDAFLALDRNGNGIIDDGGELFGDQNGAADGFAELRRYDENSDGSIDNNDTVFGRLRLFDGASLRSLASAGIAAISTLLGPGGTAVAGNPVLGSATFTRTDGTSGTVADVLLNYNA